MGLVLNAHVTIRLLALSLDMYTYISYTLTCCVDALGWDNPQELRALPRKPPLATDH